MPEDKNENKLVPVREETIDQKDEKVEKNITEIREEKKSSSFVGTIIGILCLILVVGMLFMGIRYLVTGSATHSSQPVSEVMEEQNNPALKAEKLDESRVYSLKNASDSAHNGSLTITKAQFRKDQTRIWIHMKNAGGQKINMMPAVNSMLVDNNGHSYKVDSFASDNITALAPGTDEEIMLVFEPIRQDAKSLTYLLDSVFDMQTTPWTYRITVDLP